MTSKRLIGSRYLFVGALLRVMHRKDNLSEHVTLGEALVRLAGPGEGITFGDRNFELCCLHRGVETLEFSNA